MKQNIMFLIMVFSCLFINVQAASLKEESAVVKVGNVEAPVYDVEISWGKMEFTYTECINYLWDDNNHTYELGESTFSWAAKDNYVGVNNKSNTFVDVELEYIGLNKDVIGSFDVSKKRLNSNSSSRFVLTLEGSLDNSSKVGTINLKIS